MSTQVFTTGGTWRAIGLDLPTEERADEVLALCSDKTVPVRELDSRAVFHWVDRSGASVVFNVEDGQKLVDLHQSFASGSKHEARYLNLDSGFAMVELCNPTDSSAASLAQACVKLETGYLAETGMLQGPLYLAALAQNPLLFDSLAEFEASDFANQLGEDSSRLGVPFFLSSGSLQALAGERPHAGALLAGTVRSAELHSNTLTGQNFWVVVIDLGFELTLCIGEKDLPAKPRLGNVIAGEFALVAHA